MGLSIESCAQLGAESVGRPFGWEGITKNWNLRAATAFSEWTKCATHVIRSAFVRRKVEEELSYVASKACFEGEASK